MARLPDRGPVTNARPGAGPARYLAEHPLAYLLSVAGSGGVAAYALTVAARAGRRRPDGGESPQDAGQPQPGDGERRPDASQRRRVLWLALGAQCAAQLAGIVISTERARRRARS